MSIDKIARELGKAVQESPEYKRLQIARKTNENDDELNNKIGEFNLKKLEIERLVSQKEKDQEKIAALNTEIKELYAEIMKIPSMAEFNEASNEMNIVINRINQIIKLCINGEDPETCEPRTCGSECGGCNGCG